MSSHLPPAKPAAPPIECAAPANSESTPPAIPSASPFALGVIAVIVAGYTLLSHYSTANPAHRGLAAALSIGPVLLIGVILMGRWTRPLLAVIVGIGACALLYRYRLFFEENYEWADLVEQCGAYGLIAFSFARTLFGGRVPMCTQLACALHSPLESVEIEYTRRATAAWATFYLLLAVAICVLFFTAPIRVWSIFVNFVTFGLIIAMAGADYLLRHFVLPRRQVSMLAVVQRILLG